MFEENDEFDALFTGGDPRKKFFDIVYHANRNLVEFALDDLVKRVVILETLLENEPDLEKKILSMKVTQEDDVERDALNMYMTLTASVLSNNE